MNLTTSEILNQYKNNDEILYLEFKNINGIFDFIGFNNLKKNRLF